MIDIINNLYTLALTLSGGLIVTIAVTVFYIIGIIKYNKKEMKKYLENLNVVAEIFVAAFIF